MLVEDESAEESDGIPDEIHVATTALRILYRSIRLEHICDTTVSTGDSEFSENHERTTSKSVFRELSDSEEELRDACCKSITAYILSRPLNVVPQE